MRWVGGLGLIIARGAPNLLGNLLVGRAHRLAAAPMGVHLLPFFHLPGSNKPKRPCPLPVSQDPNNPKTPEAQEIQDNYNRAAIQIAFVAGCFYTGIGVLRLG